ncbi:threonylcarbamoyl-AMP synthase [Flavobacterium sp. F-380]|uniref:Threonylcarbamoyl-AMP synthase n=1 Tax=Flavobacterium kayseriense TaxID=2764714 RepID=A0ABR7J905_9FLAO|nr:L-threonylcarbamoyladenylate synthase [Flavobacterium kayseriense]MBC5842024.1 threonylcarbamoyl-AMP synthase [Flavobacterium kayseriense]MBC5848553.1 threonylcarbamoyl-AMP synthase [Flavobacterium kayseriense]MBU0941229.1 threonylcarbamoyl-AMP synthase [Bacteroidota bacterium]
MIKTSTSIQDAKNILEQGELVAIPTETVYGLAGNIYNESAISKIFETKKRPSYNPLIVHIDSIEKLDHIVSEVPEKARVLATTFWPGSLTLVLKKKDTIPDLITAGKNTVAVRVPNHPLTLALLKSLNFPLAAPSANPFGSISPTTANHVAAYFESTVKMVLDGGACANGIESTIIGFEEGEAILYRLGAISVEEIEAVIGPLKKLLKNDTAPQAPGMLSRHYAPHTKIILSHDLQSTVREYENKKIGIISFTKSVFPNPMMVVEVLSESGSLKEASKNLYAAMHRLDNLDLDIIIASYFPENELGNSINDRLSRATKTK